VQCGDQSKGCKLRGRAVGRSSVKPREIKFDFKAWSFSLEGSPEKLFEIGRLKGPRAQFVIKLFE
jgi:hypothetical protein